MPLFYFHVQYAPVEIEINAACFLSPLPSPSEAPNLRAYPHIYPQKMWKNVRKGNTNAKCIFWEARLDLMTPCWPPLIASMFAQTLTLGVKVRYKEKPINLYKSSLYN